MRSLRRIKELGTKPLENRNTKNSVETIQVKQKPGSGTREPGSIHHIKTRGEDQKYKSNINLIKEYSELFHAFIRCKLSVKVQTIKLKNSGGEIIDT